jgi:hypothetical protein
MRERQYSENNMKENRYYIIQVKTMIFRDKKTGALLNIRRDEFNNDHLYFQEMIRNEGGAETVPLRYSRPFDEITAESQQYLKPR